MAEVNGIKVPFIPIVSNDEPARGKIKDFSGDFGSLFKTELDKLKFSSHAAKRLESRNIQLSDEEMNKIQTAVDKAEMKGSKDSLVMMNDMALIVNIPNRTVVTAMHLSDSSENIFTNIDSVVFT